MSMFKRRDPGPVWNRNVSPISPSEHSLPLPLSFQNPCVLSYLGIGTVPVFPVESGYVDTRDPYTDLV